MTADSWWVRDNGHKTGPHTAADLRRLAREGKVLPSTQVSPDQTRWMAASAVKGLFPDPTGRTNPGKPFDVFVSYSSKDKQWADTAVAYLEQRRVRCWVAPRDILAGREWGEAIIDGIDSSRLMVLIFSAHANDSGQVRREVERAISKGLPLIPFRIEEVAPKGAMEYALGNTHWLDGFTPPVERQLETLTGAVRALLSKAQPRAADGGTTAEVHVPQPARKRWPLLAGIAVAVMLLGLLAAWAGGLFTKKQEGTTGRRDEVTTRSQNKGKAKPEDTKWVPLFNGKDLTGWSPVGGPHWLWEDDRVIAYPNGAGFLMSHAEYDDYELELQYRLGDAAGSGVFLRLDGQREDLRTKNLNGQGQLEVQICDDDAPKYAKLTALQQTGSVYGVFPRTAAPSIKREDWNAMRIRLEKRHIQVWVNDTKTVDADLDAAREKFAAVPPLNRRTGRIAFQQNQRTNVEFRNVRIQLLAEKSARPLQLSSHYKTVSGDWSCDENELIQSDFMTQFSVISFGDENWTDYDFSVSAMRVKGVEQFALGVRNGVRGGPEMLLFLAAPSVSQLELQKIRGFNVLTKSPVPFKINNQKWYTAKVSVRGSRCQCFLGNGKTDVKVLDVNDARYAKGAVVLRTIRSQYRFKDIKVVAADGRTLWEGPPRIDPTLELERKRIHAARIAKLRKTLLEHTWYYSDNLYPPGGPCNFFSDGTFHIWRWKYWVIGPRAISVHYDKKRQDVETGIIYTFNENLTEFGGEFTDPKNRIHRIKGKQQ